MRSGPLAHPPENVPSVPGFVPGFPRFPGFPPGFPKGYKVTLPQTVDVRGLLDVYPQNE